jgi:hypothetical protein
MIGHLATKQVSLDRETRRPHLLVQNFFNGRRQAGAPKNPELIAGNKKRRKKRKSLYMVPMNMAEQDSPFYRCLLHKRQAKTSDARSRINDNQFITATDLNTGGIAPDTCRFLISGRNTSSNPPKFYLQAISHNFVFQESESLIILKAKKKSQKNSFK